MRALDLLAIPYMVTGSVASSYHGRPRATHDADIVIDPAPSQIEPLVNELTSTGFSEKQLGDASGVLELNPGLDRAYVERWAAQLGVSDLWRDIATRR